MDAAAMVADWAARGSVERVGDDSVFVVDTQSVRSGGAPPLLVLHGYPTSSIDFSGGARRARGRAAGDPPRLPRLRALVEARPCVLALRPRRRRGSGRRVARCRRGRPAHPRPRRLRGRRAARPEHRREPRLRRPPPGAHERSIYMHLVQLSDGQKLLESLPDEAIPEDAAPDVDGARGCPDRDAGARGRRRLASRSDARPRRRGARRARGRQPAPGSPDPLHRGAAPARRPVDRRDRDGTRPR